MQLWGHVALWLCSYVSMRLYGYVAIWLCGYVAMWLCGYYFHVRESTPPLNIPTPTPAPAPPHGGGNLGDTRGRDCISQFLIHYWTCPGRWSMYGCVVFLPAPFSEKISVYECKNNVRFELDHLTFPYLHPAICSLWHWKIRPRACTWTFVGHMGRVGHMQCF